MKFCQQCGRSHPDDVQTSHHPNGCTCHMESLHAPDSNNQGPGGCVWTRVIAKGTKTHEEAMLEHMRLVMEYERHRQADEATPKGKAN